MKMSRRIYNRIVALFQPNGGNRQRFFSIMLSLICLISFYYAFYSKYYDFSTVFSLRGPLSLNTDRLPPLVGYDRRIPHLSDADDIVYVLVWTKRFHATFPERFVHSCARISAARCLVTSSRDFLNRSAALVFHARDVILFSDLPKLKYLHQKYVFYNHEAPLLTRLPLQGAVQKSFFDWTMTYRRDSTVYCPYAYFEPLNHTSTYVDVEFPDYSDIRPVTGLEKRPKLIAWFVSNCFTDSKREQYVYKLRNYIPVDIYGQCGNLTCPKIDRRQCQEMLARNYKFYIGFENSVCHDYISEKFTNRLELDLVVIVLRRSDYDRLVPEFPTRVYEEFAKSDNDSSIGDRWQNQRRKHQRSWWFFIAADDFENPKDLADYLYFLHDNPRQYLRYFEWRKYWRIMITGDQHCFCELCSKLYVERERLRGFRKNGMDEIRNEDLDIHKWWNVGACERNYAARFAMRRSK